MIDGYELYDLIEDGKPHSVAVGEASFQFQFKGQKFGSSNWLEVTAANGDTKKWGLGLELRSLLALLARPRARLGQAPRPPIQTLCSE